MTLNFNSEVCCFEESNVNLVATSCSPCVCRYLVGTQRMFLLDPIQYKTEYNQQCAKYKRQNLTYSYLLSLCTRVDIYNKELNLNIWRSKLSDKSKFPFNMSSGNIYCYEYQITEIQPVGQRKNYMQPRWTWKRHKTLHIYVIASFFRNMFQFE